MRVVATILLAATTLCWVGCDTVRPDRPGTLVVEAYVEAGMPLPPVRVFRTRALADTTSDPVSEAAVRLSIDGTDVAYLPSATPGTWLPEPAHAGMTANPGARFRVDVEAGADRAGADGTVPSRLQDVDIRVDVADHPVQAVLLDSLSLPLDSLQLELPSRTGYVYAIVVTLGWDDPDPEAWVALEVEPRVPFSSTLLEYFLRPSAVARESAMTDGGRASWIGVYAVPVDDDDSPVPEHDLLVSVVRGDAAWAAFAASAGDPPRREPVSNVDGGIGIVTGVSVVRRIVSVP